MESKLSPEELESTKSFLKIVNEVRRKNNANAVDLSLQTAVKFMMVSNDHFPLASCPVAHPLIHSTLLFSLRPESST